METLKVSALSRPQAVAGSVAACLRRDAVVVVQAIGAGAVNQAVKALALARGYLAGEGLDLICRPAFRTLDVDGQERTAIALVVERRSRGDHERLLHAG